MSPAPFRVHRGHFGGRHCRRAPPCKTMQPRPPGQAHGTGQRADLTADGRQILRAAPDLRLSRFAEQVVQAWPMMAFEPGPAKIDHGHVTERGGQRHAGVFGHSLPCSGANPWVRPRGSPPRNRPASGRYRPRAGRCRARPAVGQKSAHAALGVRRHHHHATAGLPGRLLSAVSGSVATPCE